MTGNVLGVDADIALMEFRTSDGRRSLDHIKGDYYIPPAFMDAFAVHMAKNYLYDSIQGKVWRRPSAPQAAQILAQSPGMEMYAPSKPCSESVLPLHQYPQIPLILGIWGHKGCGKTFNLELVRGG